MKKLLFVYNAKSGKTMIRKHLADIIDLFIKSGYYVESYQTQSALDAKKQIAARGNNFDLIVVAGGDGTLNEAISGMMKLNRKIPIGYIPAGSTNDFATSLKLPKNMRTAAKVAVKGTPTYIDVGDFNRRTFVYIACFGIFTDVSYSTSQDMKNLLGHSAYLIEALKRFGDIMTSYHFKIEYDDGKVMEDDFILGMVTNSVSAAGFKGITGTNIILDDGLFEVTLLKRPKNAIELQDMISGIIHTRPCKNIITFKTKRIKFTSNEKVKWVLDGEFGGQMRKVLIRNKECAVKVMTGLPLPKRHKRIIRGVKNKLRLSK